MCGWAGRQRPAVGTTASGVNKSQAGRRGAGQEAPPPSRPMRSPGKQSLAVHGYAGAEAPRTACAACLRHGAGAFSRCPLLVRPLCGGGDPEQAIDERLEGGPRSGESLSLTGPNRAP